MECEAQGIVQSSSENKADYSSQRAMQEYAIAILQELPTIDRAQNTEELNAIIYEMLRLLGKCSGAQRAYIFDATKDGQFVNTYI